MLLKRTVLEKTKMTTRVDANAPTDGVLLHPDDPDAATVALPALENHQ